MPWKVVKKKDDDYRLYNLDKKTFVRTKFKTRKSASNAKKNYENYYKKKK